MTENYPFCEMIQKRYHSNSAKCVCAKRFCLLFQRCVSLAFSRVALKCRGEWGSVCVGGVGLGGGIYIHS